MSKLTSSAGVCGAWLWIMAAMIAVARFFGFSPPDEFWYPSFMVSGAIMFGTYILCSTLEKVSRDFLQAQRDRDFSRIAVEIAKSRDV
jgi:hypothetical protein